MKAIAREMYRWGPKGVNTYAGLIALVVSIVVLVVVFTRPVDVIPTTTQQNILPATGEQGFNAKTFCEDSLTSVSKVIAPDASGVTYQMQRVKDGVSETVTIVLAQTHDVLFATHYWDTPNGQQSEPAFVDEGVEKCLERKS